MAPTEQKPHLLVHGTAETQRYKYPKAVRGGGKLKLKPKDRASPT